MIIHYLMKKSYIDFMLVYKTKCVVKVFDKETILI